MKKVSKNFSFKLDPSCSVSFTNLAGGSSLLISSAFIKNNFSGFDEIISGTIYIKTDSNSFVLNKYKVYYFDSNQNKIYIDTYSLKHIGSYNYLVFDISSFLISKIYLVSNFYFENLSNVSLKVFTQTDHIFEGEYIPSSGFNKEGAEIQIGHPNYACTYNLLSSKATINRPLFNNLIFYNVSLIYSTALELTRRSLLPRGWNLNLLEYLVFDNGIPITYIDRNNIPHEISTVANNSDLFYTSDGTSLLIQKELDDSVVQYRLFSEFSPSTYRLFNSEGKIKYFHDKNNNYISFTHQKYSITIIDSNGNEIVIAYDSGTDNTTISLNSNCYTFITNFIDNLTSLCHGQNTDTFVYNNDKLSEIDIADGHKLIIERAGSLFTSLTYKFGDNTLESYSFSYECLKRFVTDRHGVTTVYNYDLDFNMTSSGEIVDNEELNYTYFDKKELVKEVSFAIRNKSHRYAYYNTANYTYINSNSSSLEQRLFGFQDNPPFMMKAGHSYMLMATLEKLPQNFVIRSGREVYLKIYTPLGDEICTLNFNPYLTKQTAITTFRSPITETGSGNYAYVKAWGQGMLDCGYAKVSNVELFEIDENAVTYLIRKLNSSDPIDISNDNGPFSIGGYNWYEFSTSEDTYNESGEPITRHYSYTDLVKNYINVERNLPYFWCENGTELMYRYDSTRSGNINTGGYPLRSKLNLPAANTAIARKTSKKFVTVDNVEKELFSFEYVEGLVSQSSEHEIIYHTIEFFGSDSYETTETYDIDLKLKKSNDYYFDIEKRYTYNSNGLITVLTKEAINTSLPIYQTRFAYDSLNRNVSTSSFVQDDIESSSVEYISSFSIVSKLTDQNDIETTYSYDTNYEHCTQISVGLASINFAYSYDSISSLSNSSTFTYTYDDYGLVSAITMNSELAINHPTILSTCDRKNNINIGSLQRQSLWSTKYNKYGNICTIDEKNSTMFPTYTNKVKFLYYETKPSDIASKTTQDINSVKGKDRLYKIIDNYSDDYSSRNIYFDYYNNDVVKEIEIKNSSNNLINKIEYQYDDLDRKSYKKMSLDSSNYVAETYNYLNPFSEEINIIDYSLSGLLLGGSPIHEEIEKDELRRVTSIKHYNNALLMNYVLYKMDFTYVSKTITENSVSTVYTNDLVGQIDYTKLKLVNTNPLPLINNYEAVEEYDHSEFIAYYPDGSISSIRKGTLSGPTSNTGVSYIYDSLNQLIEEDNYDYGFKYIYSYDNNGNILSASIYNILNNVLISSESYVYNDAYKDKLTSFKSQTISYDNNLNIISIGNSLSYSWTRRGNLDKVTIGTDEYTFVYNYDGIRTKKVDSRGEHEYILDGHRILGEIITSDSTTNKITYLYGQNGLFALIYNFAIYYLQKNILGDITTIFNGENIVARYIYDAFGNHKIVDSNGVEITSSTHIARINPFRYRGYYYDEDTNLYYCNARYYSPELRRWISIDPYEYINKETILGLNLYAYCKNNPISYRDEDGHMAAFWAVIILGLIGAAGGFISQTITDLASGRGFDIGRSGIAAFAGFVGGMAMAIPVFGKYISPSLTSGLNTILQMKYSGNDYTAHDYIRRFVTSVVIGGVVSYAFGKALLLNPFFSDLEFFAEHYLEFVTDFGGLQLSATTITLFTFQIAMRSITFDCMVALYSTIFDSDRSLISILLPLDKSN